MLAIPLIAGDQRLGMLDVWRNGLDAFSEEDLERCALLGFITAAAWSNAQMYGELERRALTDALTGLFNIRWWRDMGPRVMAQSLRTGAGVGILLMDLDHFKQINDSAGHAAGRLRAARGGARHPACRPRQRLRGPLRRRGVPHRAHQLDRRRRDARGAGAAGRRSPSCARRPPR